MRRKSYTEIGIRRLKCFRCGKIPTQQWQICADDNQYRAICIECDIKLNEIILKFMKFDDWKEKIHNYKYSLNNQKP